MKSNRQARHILGKVIHNHQSSMTIKHHCLRNGVFVFICSILGADALAVKQRR